MERAIEDLAGSGLRGVLVLVVVAMTAVAALTPTAHAATTGTYDYDATDEAVEPCVAVTVPADQRADTTLARSPVDPNHRYDDFEQRAGTNARPGGGLSAPQTSQERPCRGMTVYRVYAPALVRMNSEPRGRRQTRGL